MARFGMSADFNSQAKPVFLARCAQCHGAGTAKAGLRLDSAGGALRGGTDGPVIIPGQAGKSPIIARVTSDKPGEMMPPKGSRLTPAEISALREWIDSGAKGGRPEDERDPRLDHWAWQPVGGMPTPAGNPVDHFINARLKAAGLSPAPSADRRSLIRRLSFDLLGLPPSPEEVTAFVNDSDPQAFAKLVDRYLDSPRYGERQARHWLDIAHYADTHGFERDQRRENAWRYRDWVIRAFNADMPYDRFLGDQIAGDQFRPGDPEAVAATGFLAAGPWDFVGQAETPSPVLKRQARADDLDDMVTQVMAAACGVTVNCARCHDHKLDPISQKEYYGLWAVFSGARRGDRPLDPKGEARRDDERKALQAKASELRAALARLDGKGLSLADAVGGGDGLGSGTRGAGINPATGRKSTTKAGFISGAVANQYRALGGLVDGVVIPGGGDVPVSSTGIVAKSLPKTSANAWDAVRNGPVNQQRSTSIAGTDYSGPGHDILGLHANAAITFDLAKARATLKADTLRFTAMAGYGGRPGDNSTKADLRVLADGVEVDRHLGLNPASGPLAIDIPLGPDKRFLTLVATEGTDGGIGHDQVFLGDARLLPSMTTRPSAAETANRREVAEALAAIERQISAIAPSPMVYAINGGPPEAVRVLKRGNPEAPGEETGPGALSCLKGARPLEATSDMGDGARRAALARWIAQHENPLTARVIVNRLWHHHFGAGIVGTPSDFGAGGGKPSHPELLDWLAGELVRRRWSLKAMHRVICASEAYQRSSLAQDPKAAMADAGNRLLWRQNPRRLDAESLRDAVLATSGQLDLTPFGPGYRDFVYQEAYAPIYRHIDDDSPSLRRRSIYRFVVRTTPQPFLTTLDCPNPANLSPSRTETTTAVQSLALLNNPFMLRQARHFARRLSRDAGDSTDGQVGRAFALAFARAPSRAELDAAMALVRARDLPELCRMLLNASEFCHVD
jgi:mono/diheme cytochrome c family protein